LPDFILDPRLSADTLPVADLTLSTVRLMRDANYPWLLLVPRRNGLAEIVDLAPAERTELMAEIAVVSSILRASVPCEKLNVAALGIMVRQLHVHIIARSSGDAAWPKPVWGAAPSRPYPPGEAEALAETLAARLEPYTDRAVAKAP
jgi:diadenosine tetraphosphate (Ap4A) HIT family hydrolase